MTVQEERLVEAYEKATEMLDTLDIDYGNVTELQVNTRSKRRWGQCSYNVINDTFKISIASKLLDDDVTERGLLNTLIHELLHTCKGCLNHGEEWKTLADKVNAKYDLGIKRCNSAAEKGLDESYDYKPLPAKYFLQCPNCGHIYKRKRMCYPVAHPEKCGCPRCNHWGLERISG